ncbi:MAG: hypothetical protein RPU15_14985 [Candidatus Sedimenticola sp. (ex Thyasira tokunagai)]
MKTGRELIPEQFFVELSRDDEFCKELGKAMLAAGRLESELIRYLTNVGVSSDLRKANLGRLIRSAKKHALLSDLVPHIEDLNRQRNYLAHNIHALFHGLIEETILERNGLLDSDTHTFMERAWQLAENLNALADIVANYDENT